MLTKVMITCLSPTSKTVQRHFLGNTNCSAPSNEHHWGSSASSRGTRQPARCPALPLPVPGWPRGPAPAARRGPQTAPSWPSSASRVFEPGEGQGVSGHWGCPSGAEVSPAALTPSWGLAVSPRSLGPAERDFARTRLYSGWRTPGLQQHPPSQTRTGRWHRHMPRSLFPQAEPCMGAAAHQSPELLLRAPSRPQSWTTAPSSLLSTKGWGHRGCIRFHMHSHAQE